MPKTRIHSLINHHYCSKFKAEERLRYRYGELGLLLKNSFRGLDFFLLDANRNL